MSFSANRRVLETGYYLAVLFLSTGAFQSLLIDTSSMESGAAGSPVLRLLWIGMSLIAFIRCIRRRQQVARLIRANKALSALVLLSTCSLLWSVDPSLTLHIGLVLLGTTLVGLDLAVRRTLSEQLNLLIPVLGLITILSVLTELLAPGLMYHDSPAWQGAFEFKNVFGRFLALTAAAFLSYPVHSQKGAIVKGLAMVALVGIVIKGHSAGALLYVVLLILLYKGSAIFRWHRKILLIASVLLLMVAIPAIYYVSNNVEAAAALLGRDATLTGRTDLWDFAIKSVFQHPLLGHGYGAFWSPASHEAEAIRESIGWQAPTSHNGYLDLLLDFGLVGIGLYFTSYFVAVRRAVIVFRNARTEDAVWPMLFLIFIILCQLSEASIVHGNSIYWVLYISITFGLYNEVTADESSVARRDSLPNVEVTKTAMQY